jgi:DNA-binding response OmpR family regulator
VLPEHKHRAIDAGCDDFETKPVDLPRLLAKIQNLLRAAG